MRGVGSRKVDEHGVPIGDHRCTPKDIVDVALEAIGIEQFDLDPASNEHSIVAARFRWSGPKVGGEDGLALPWFGNTWLNWPWSDSMLWVGKIQHEADKMVGQQLHVHEGESAPWSMTLLGPGDSSVIWWRALRQLCDARAMWPKRVHFPLPNQAKGSPPAPVHLWYIGPRSNRWRRIMESHGVPTEAGAVC